MLLNNVEIEPPYGKKVIMGSKSLKSA